MLFAATPLVPHFIEFNPGAGLVPASGYFLGPAGAAVSLAASLLGDYWTGLWSPLSLFKAAGVFLCALSAWALRSSGPFSLHGFAVAGSLSTVAAGVWAGIGAEVLRLYPFTYISAVQIIQYAVFFFLLMPAAWNAGSRLRPIAGAALSARAYIVGGMVGAWGFATFVSAAFYKAWPFERYHLSDYTGLALLVCIAPLAALHLLGLGKALIARP
jgi:hypothetical protein